MKKYTLQERYDLYNKMLVSERASLSSDKFGGSDEERHADLDAQGIPRERKEGKELIAEYMGGTKQIVSSKMEGGYKEGTVLWHNLFDEPGVVTYLDFDSSWEWLMSVVEKIMQHKYEDGDTAYLRTFGMINAETGNPMVRFNRHQVFEAPTLFQATYLAVLDFITTK